MDCSLERLGWNPSLEASFEPFARDGYVPARVAVEHRSAYVVYTTAGELWAEVSGRMRYEIGNDPLGLPVVGDWVAVRPVAGEDKASIRAVLVRRATISRKLPFRETAEQILAANVDALFILSALNLDRHARRIERALTMAWESGTQPVVVLTKADLCDDPDEAAAEVAAAAVGAPVHVTSAVTRRGVDELLPYFAGHRTVALIGPSGTGKSTLVNLLYGDELLAVREIRQDGRGRHTSVRRELVVLPMEGLVIDTPGLREMQLWGGDEAIPELFEDVEALAAACRFNDCVHDREPGCAVRAAIAAGELDAGRLIGYRKLSRELVRLAAKKDKRLASVARKKRNAKMLGIVLDDLERTGGT